MGSIDYFRKPGDYTYGSSVRGYDRTHSTFDCNNALQNSMTTMAMEDIIGLSMLKVGRLFLVCSRFKTLRIWANNINLEFEHGTEKEFVMLCNKSYKKNAKRLRENSSQCEEDELWEWLGIKFEENQEALEGLSLLINHSDVLARDRTMDEGYRWARSNEIEKEIARSIEKAEAPMRRIIDEFKEGEEAMVRHLQETNRWRSSSLLMKNCPNHMGSDEM